MDWKQALDIQMDCHKWHASDVGTHYTINYISGVYQKASEDQHGRVFDRTEIEIIRSFIKEDYDTFLSSLWQADTCFITSEMLQIAMQAAHDMPDGMEMDFHNLMSPVGFLLLEEGIFGEDVWGEMCGFHALVWNNNTLRYNGETEQMEKCLELFFLSSSFDEMPESNRFVEVCRDQGIPVPAYTILHTYRIFDGDSIQHIDLPGAHIVEEILKVFYAIQLLAQQSIGEPMRIDPPRASRKRVSRYGMSDQTYITLITLRRKSVKKENGDEPPIERTHRWIVRGHWRKQPDKHGWHWKYIFEHIKGPEDKPLIISERRVFNFRR